MYRVRVAGGLLVSLLILKCGIEHAQRTTAALYGILKDRLAR